MTEEQILEGNKLIAEFMGASEDNYPENIPNGVEVWGNPMSIINIGKYKYDTSWDWLMPVVEKIESLSFNVVIGFNTYCGIIKSQKLINDKTPRFESVEVVRESNIIYTKSSDKKIEGVFICILKFIKWYNEQNKK